jgi:hypothetical protein
MEDKPQELPQQMASEKLSNRPHRRFSIFWPFLLIALGIVLLVQNTGLAPGLNGYDLLRLWPLLLIVGGLDSFWQGHGYVGGTLSIGLGVIFLLSNLGYLPGVSVWDVILRFWPLLIVALGLDLIIGRRKVISPLIGALVGLLLVAIVGWLVLTSPMVALSPATTQSVSYPASGLTAAAGTINMPVGRLQIAKSVESANLVSGQISLTSGLSLNQDFQNSNASSASYSLSANGPSGYVSFGSFTDSNRWDLKLSPEVALDLDIRTGAGDQIIDLSGLKITRLSVNLAVGSAQVTLPASGSFSGEIKGAVGEIIVWVPRGALARFSFDTALTSVSVPPEWGSAGSILAGHQVFTTPGASSSSQVMDLSIGEAVGSVSIRYLP